MNKKAKAKGLVGCAIGLSVGLYAIGWREVDYCLAHGLCAVLAYMGAIYWHGGRVTWGSMIAGAPLIFFAAFIVGTLLFVPGQEGRGLVMGSLAFLLSLVPYWVAKLAIKSGKIADGKLIN